MSKAAQRKEKQQWATQPKLDNARKLRGIYFIYPDDKELKETIQNARKNLELPMEAAMPAENDETSTQAARNRQRIQRIQQQSKRQSIHAS